MSRCYNVLAIPAEIAKVCSSVATRARVTDRESRLFRRHDPKARVKRRDCSADNSVCGEAHTDWWILIVFHIDARHLPPSPPPAPRSRALSFVPSTRFNCAAPSTKWCRACCSPTIIGVINADRENPMCARAKRVTRLQKRPRGGEGRGGDATRRALIGCEGWGTPRIFREVVDLFPLFFVRRTKSSAAGIYRRERRDLRRALFADVYLIP